MRLTSARRERITLLVPFHTDHGARATTWAWLQKYWAYHLPGAELVVVDSSAVPFCKTAAVNTAFFKSCGDIVVILDADCYFPGDTITWCAEQIRAARRKGHHLWFLPYRRFYRMTEHATSQVLASPPAHPLRFSDPPRPGQYEPVHSPSSGHYWGALVQIMPREAFIAAYGMDEYFAGWGGEDVAFMHAVDTLYGKHRTVNAAVYHLWHPTLKGRWLGTRQWEGQATVEINDELGFRYADAIGDRQRMRRLVTRNGSRFHRRAPVSVTRQSAPRPSPSTQEKPMSIERAVAILTPVFGAVAAWLTGLIGAHIPGVNIPPDQIIALEVAGFTGATAAALKWLHGRSQFVNAEKSAVAVEAKVRAEIAASPQAALAIGDVERLLKSHTVEIEAAIDQHVPTAVGDALRVLFSQLTPAAPPSPAAAPPPPVGQPWSTTGP